uniref:Uncharacterized protein n=1 Tax=Glossina pallidipes TaxID=7398 RepID=A0A1A9Z1P0_GLOPL
MLSSSRSESEKVPLALCCDMYSALRASKSTVIPLACSFLACLSIALANFFLRLALQWKDNKTEVRRRDSRREELKLILLKETNREIEKKFPYLLHYHGMNKI